jgi:hypothetical protein
MKPYTTNIGVIILALLTTASIGCVAPGPGADRVEQSISPENDATTNLIEVLDPDSPNSDIEFQIPDRLPDSSRSVLEPPEVPENLENLDPLTATIQVRVELENGSAETGSAEAGSAEAGSIESLETESIETIRSVIRTPSRVYVNYLDQGQEWLFIRNPRDGRRVSGHLVDHREAAVLFFYEQDLANADIVSGWGDAVSMGISVDHLIPTGEFQRHHGLDFQRYVEEVPESPGGNPATEVWWSQEQALPWKVSQTNGSASWVQEIVELDWTIDSTLLAEPAGRYPQYEALDVVDWREKR